MGTYSVSEGYACHQTFLIAPQQLSLHGFFKANGLAGWDISSGVLLQSKATNRRRKARVCGRVSDRMEIGITDTENSLTYKDISADYYINATSQTNNTNHYEEDIGGDTLNDNQLFYQNSNGFDSKLSAASGVFYKYEEIPAYSMPSLLMALMVEPRAYIEGNILRISANCIYKYPGDLPLEGARAHEI